MKIRGKFVVIRVKIKAFGEHELSFGNRLLTKIV